MTDLTPPPSQEALALLREIFRECAEAGVCAGPPCECAASIDRFRAEERERCAKIAETFFPPAHTYASENADIYHAQDDAQCRIAARIREEKS